MDPQRTEFHVKELYAILREYESELLVTSDPDQQRWLRNVITHLHAATIEIENAGE